MLLKLTRRRFGKLAIASTVVAGIGHLASKTFAQTPNLVIYGALPEPQAGGIRLQSLDLVLGQVQSLTTTNLQLNERLSGFTSLPDGTLVLGLSPFKTGEENNPLRLMFVGGRSARTPISVSGLKKQDTLETFLGTNDGSLYGLVIKKNGRPPMDLVDININTGQVSFIDKIKLPTTVRYSNLAQGPNGTIYTTVVGDSGETNLMQLDLGQGKPIFLARLNFNGTVWDHGLSDLVCSPSGQLLALGAHKYVTPNNLYTVNPSNGAMTFLRTWDVTKITTSRAI